MSRKTAIWIGIFVGGTVGSFVPLVWGANLLSLWPILLSGIGSLAGIWLAVKYF